MGTTDLVRLDINSCAGLKLHSKGYNGIQEAADTDLVCCP